MRSEDPKIHRPQFSQTFKALKSLSHFPKPSKTRRILLTHCLQPLLCWSSHGPPMRRLLVTNLQCILRRSVRFSIWFRLLLFFLLLGAHDGEQHVQHGLHQVALYHRLRQDTKCQMKHCCVDVYLFHAVAFIHSLRPAH